MLKKILNKTKPAAAPPLPDLSGELERRYFALIDQAHIQYDAAQHGVLAHLQDLLNGLIAHASHDNKPAAQKLFSPRPARCKSLYIYGGVGRGKSMLMELFYESCPFPQKRRVHFNTFMTEVHTFVHRCRQQKITDALLVLAEQIRNSTRLLCFDEFHVTDIADAMILGRLFNKLFELGVVTVITSNRHPNELYQGGLQREQFLFFIKVLQNEANIVQLAAKKDFRLRHLHALQKAYYTPLDSRADAFLRQSYDELTHFSEMKPVELPVFGRTVRLAAAHGDVAYTSFEELCVQPLGAADYLKIAGEFSTIIMANIPKLTAAYRNEAKRFVTLIDALYEHKVKLICAAEAPARELYTEGDGAFEFERTVSRLMEMQSESYLRSEHLCDVEPRDR
ncbi:cell division protein ZapE [Methylomicrobium sp. Wu6]|uniref:cell division protein ZapE n=1 Tax=Methylomicrobium sp. Wu6 TaxID=3107928 RepID=UPI002DD6B927|nr:cell division protein ZapE [Methylomicrobium sp. Wu6]MEC4749313.1 cell division protein ZapE [Methylomicrobium sp. Wu6]